MTTSLHLRRKHYFLAAAACAVALSGVPAARASEIAFEPNQGQTDPRARFLARGRGYVLFLAPREAILALPMAGTPLRMRLAGAHEAEIAGEGLLPGRSHYFLGADPGAWRQDVPSFERVRYRAVYPGTDLVFYGKEGELEYDFVFAPGADPRQVAMDLSGVAAPRVDRDGNLVLTTGAGKVVWRKPIAYQVGDGERHEVASRYTLRGTRVGFEVAAYDRTRPLVVDPTLSYSTYLGGGGADAGHAIAVDAAGNAYVAGETASVNFPGTGTLRGLLDAFVTKFDPSGATRIYSAYLGGDGSDVALGVVVDAGGSIYLTGDTKSSDFPTTAGAYQRVRSTGSADAFVTKLSAAGALVYSTLLGGPGPDQGSRGQAIALDSSGNMVVTGRTDSAEFPVTAGAFFTSFRGEVFDAFVVKLNPAASGAASLVYSTFLGGSKNDAGFGIALDSADNVYVTGGTSSPDFPATASAYQGSSTASSTDAFFTKLNANATGLLYSTFIGGSLSNERANGIGLDASGNAVITGQTTSPDFPTKNPVQTYQGGYDAFVAKFDPTASGNASLLYSTYLGGSGNDTGRAIAVDATGRVYVTGQTTSSADFPIGNAVQATYGGGFSDAFVTKLNAAGTARLYSTFLGGNDAEGTSPTLQGGHGIAVSPCGDAWVTGRTLSPNFPTQGPTQPAPGGQGDAFVARIIDPDPPTVAGVVPQWGPLSGGSVVSIVGTCFRPGATATFGGAAASGVTVARSTVMTATTPAHAPGAVDVVVTNPSLPPATRVAGFTYGATGFFSVPPCRVVDTRNPIGPLGGPALAANADRTFAVTGPCGIPASAGAVSVNLTATQPSAPGHLRLYPGGTVLPLVSSLNYAGGQTRANSAILPLGPGGTVTVRSVQASGTVHFVVDVNGYYR